MTTGLTKSQLDAVLSQIGAAATPISVRSRLQYP